MADVNANIGVGIETSDALAQLKNLQRQISQFHTAVAKSSESAAIAQRDLQKNFLNSVNAIQGFSAELRTVKTTAESFTTSLEKNKFSVKEYFRYAAGATKTFGKTFRNEFDTIEKTARERVKTLQTQYIEMGRNAQGAMQAIAIRPTILDMDNLGTQTQIAAQKQAIFNQLVKQGSTQLLNFGKNTQWAGRQLMVGFTLPLATLGVTAGKAFMQMEQAALKFRKVYGDLFTTQADTQAALDGIMALAKGYTQYGIAVADTVSLAADAAAAGYQGVDLQNQTAAATKLSVLGQIDQQKSLETTIALQNAFSISSADLASNIDFLNAVENQTVTSLDDITTAIPKVAPVIQQLGGDVKDLAFFLTAMKEGGINASEGANALKSGLGALINPTKKASDMLNGFGINVRSIVTQNQGDLKATVVDFAKALDTLAPLDRARAIEQMFGKFQFARLSTLFQNVSKDGTQASRVLELAGSSVSDLAALSEKELGQTAASSMMKFKKAIEDVKAALAPLGQMFMEIATPFIDIVKNILDGFNNLPDGIKKAIGTVVGVIGGLGPIALMTFGLINNGIANMIKFIANVRLGFLKITGRFQGIGEETQYMTTEQLNAAAAAASLEQSHSKLTQQFTAEKSAVDALKVAYEQAAAAGGRFAALNPGMMKPGSQAKPKKYASGGQVGGSGNGDTVAAMLTPGEFVVNQKAAQAMLPFLEALNSGKLPGFSDGGQVKRVNANPSLYGGASVTASGLGLPGVPGNAGGSTYGMSKDFFRSGAGLGNSLMAAGIGGGAGLELGPGQKITNDMIDSYQNEIKNDIPKIVDALRQTEKDMIANGENISSMEDITAKAKTKLEKIFADMEKRGGRSAKAAKALKEHAFFPTEEAMTGRMREERVAGVRGSSKGGLTPSTYRIKSSPFQSKATAAFKRITGTTAESQGSYAHINEQRRRGAGTPLSGGAMALPPEQRKAYETALEAESKKLAAKYPEGKTVTRAISTQDIKVAQSNGAAVAQAYKKGEESAKVPDPYVESRDRNSPHRLAGQDGADDGKAYAAARARESKRAQAAQGAPGSSPIVNPNAVANTQAAAAARQPRRASRAADSTAPVAEKTTANLNKLNGKITAAGIALTTLAGAGTMFGGVIGDISSTIFAVSSAFVGLSSVIQLLTKTTMAQLVADRLKAAADAGSAITSILPMGGIKQMGGVINYLKTLFTNLGGFLKNFIGGAMGIITKLGMIGLAIGAAFAAFTIISNLIAEQKKRIEGLGAASSFTADQIKNLGEKLGVSVKTVDYANRGKTAIAGATTADQKGAQSYLQDEQFLKDYETAISGIKNATVDQAQQALTALSAQLSASGFGQDAVKQIVGAIGAAAGKTALKIDFSSVNLDTPGATKSVTDLATSAADTYANSFKNDLGRRSIFDGLSEQGRAAGQTLAGTYKSAIDTLILGFESGKVSAEDMNTSIEQMLNKINNAPMPDWMLLNLADKMGIKDLVNGFESVQGKTLAIKANIAGMNISDKDKGILNKGFAKGASAKDLAAAQSAQVRITAAIKAQTVAQQKLNTEAEKKIQIDADIEAANASIDDRTKALETEIAANKILVQAGFDKAAAYAIATNATYAAALAAAQLSDQAGTTTTAVADMLAKFKALTALEAKAPKAPSAAEKTTPYQDAIKQLKEQKKEVYNNSAAFQKLKKSGMEVSKAFEIAKDPILAAALAAEKVGSKKWLELVKRINAAEAAAKKFQQSTTQGKKEFLDEVTGKAMAIFDAQEAIYNAALEQKTAADNKLIDQLQNQIDGYNRSIGDMEHQLDGIQEKEDAINKAYDEKVKSLEQVKKINQDIINQQKSQLSIADALSSGDVSAAATAIQQSRAENASAAMTSQSDMLDAARQAQLAQVTSTSGKTRKELETAIKDLKDKIYVIETGSLRAAQDRVTAANNENKALVDGIKVQGMTKDAWIKIKDQTDLAQAKSSLFRADVATALKDAKLITKEWNTPAVKKVSVIVTTTNVAAGKAAAKSMGGIVPKYLAGGGSTTGFGAARGTDTIPAMLTPGEFVVNRSAAQANGGLLSAINSGKGKSYKSIAVGSAPEMIHAYETAAKAYAPRTFNQELITTPTHTYNTFDGTRDIASAKAAGAQPAAESSNPVYNYNLSVNVDGSNLDANDVANVVMNKLRSVKSQQLRGQVVR